MPSRPSTRPTGSQERRSSAFVRKDSLSRDGSIEHLRKLQSGTARIDRRPFRPNIYVDSVCAGDGFVEDDWLGKTLILGEHVELDEFQPTLWCVTSTLIWIGPGQAARAVGPAVLRGCVRRGERTGCRRRLCRDSYARVGAA